MLKNQLSQKLPKVLHDWQTQKPSLRQWKLDEEMPVVQDIFFWICQAEKIMSIVPIRFYTSGITAIQTSSSSQFKISLANIYPTATIKMIPRLLLQVEFSLVFLYNNVKMPSTHQLNYPCVKLFMDENVLSYESLIVRLICHPRQVLCRY